MTLLTFAATGHVLGAVTRTGRPESAPKPVDIVGESLLVRDPETGQLQMHVAPERLSSVLVDRADQVLIKPRAYAVDSGLLEEQEALPTGFALTLDGTVIKVDLNQAVTEQTTVWVQIEGDAISNPIVRTLQIPETKQMVEEPLTLAAGHYSALIMIPGFHTAIRKQSIP
jgi:hypothetical protein